MTDSRESGIEDELLQITSLLRDKEHKLQERQRLLDQRQKQIDVTYRRYLIQCEGMGGTTGSRYHFSQRTNASGSKFVEFSEGECMQAKLQLEALKNENKKLQITNHQMEKQLQHFNTQVLLHFVKNRLRADQRKCRWTN